MTQNEQKPKFVYNARANRVWLLLCVCYIIIILLLLYVKWIALVHIYDANIILYIVNNLENVTALFVRQPTIFRYNDVFFFSSFFLFIFFCSAWWYDKISTVNDIQFWVNSNVCTIFAIFTQFLWFWIFFSEKTRLYLLFRIRETSKRCTIWIE